MTLAELGSNGMAELIEHQSGMSALLRSRLESKGWIVVHDSPLAILCFTHPGIESGGTTVSEVVDRVVGSGRAWISQVRLSGPTAIALRACITSHRTQPADIDVLVGELERAIPR